MERVRPLDVAPRQRRDTLAAVSNESPKSNPSGNACRGLVMRVKTDVGRMRVRMPPGVVGETLPDLSTAAKCYTDTHVRATYMCEQGRRAVFH